MKTLVLAALVLATPVLAQDDSPPDATPEAPAPPKKKVDVSKLHFTPDSIKQVMGSQTDAIQQCYEETMAEKNKAVEGKLVTSFVINKDGLVKRARVARAGTGLRGAGLHDCVVGVLSALTFPKPPDGRDHPIEYPFNLKAQR